MSSSRVITVDSIALLIVKFVRHVKILSKLYGTLYNFEEKSHGVAFDHPSRTEK